MSDHETVEKVKEKQGLLAKIQNFLTFGYGAKEDLRELDKQLRTLYYTDLKDLRHTWEDLYLSVLDTGIKGSNRDLKKVLQTLDIVTEKIHRADYGYAGLLDRQGHIREQELEGVFNYDKSLSEHIENIKEAVTTTQKDVESENFTEVRTDVKRVKGLLLAFMDKWRKREKQFKPLKV